MFDLERCMLQNEILPVLGTHSVWTAPRDYVLSGQAKEEERAGPGGEKEWGISFASPACFLHCPH